MLNIAFDKIFYYVYLGGTSGNISLEMEANHFEPTMLCSKLVVSDSFRLIYSEMSP